MFTSLEWCGKLVWSTPSSFILPFMLMKKQLSPFPGLERAKIVHRNNRLKNWRKNIQILEVVYSTDISNISRLHGLVGRLHALHTDQLFTHFLLASPKYASTLYKFELGRFKDSIREHTHKISHHCKIFEIMKTHLVK